MLRCLIPFSQFPINFQSQRNALSRDVSRFHWCFNFSNIFWFGEHNDRQPKNSDIKVLIVTCIFENECFMYGFVTGAHRGSILIGCYRGNSIIWCYQIAENCTKLYFGLKIFCICPYELRLCKSKIVHPNRIENFLKAKNYFWKLRACLYGQNYIIT